MIDPPSMIIYDFYIPRTILCPYETDTPLVIYPNAVLTNSVTFQWFQPISGRYAKVVKKQGPIQLSKLTHGHPLYMEPTINTLPAKKRFRILTFKT